MLDNKIAFAAAMLTTLVSVPERAAAQDAEPATTVVYHREVFTYPAANRPDPFRSLLDAANLQIRFDDLTLLGVVYNPDPSQSVAVLSQTGAERRIQVRAGERFGNIRVIAIHPRRIELLIEEFGVARRESLELNMNNEKGSGS